MDEDFYDEDISPAPEQIDGQTMWQTIVNHPHFKKAVIAAVAVVVLLVVCIVGLVIAVSVLASDSDDTNATENTATGNTTYTFNTLPETSSSLASDTGCASYYGSEETGWSYGVMVDLGSSGSRISIFEWKENEPVQPAPQNGPPYWYRKQNPGVSSYIVPEEAANSLIPLLDYAEEKLDCVNANLEETPIFLFATAGLRLLPSVQSTAILNSIRSLILEEYSFEFEENWARILSGTEEAIYDWLSVQQIALLYSNNNIDKYAKLQQQMKSILDESEGATIGVVDMGGGSVEVTFDPNGELGSAPDETSFQDVLFNRDHYNVYGYSYLYYGHNEARDNVIRIIINEQTGDELIAGDPCNLVGFNTTFTADNGQSWDIYGTGNYTQCAEYTRSLFDKDCDDWEPCSFNNVYQPPIGDKDFVALDGLARVVFFLELDDKPVLTEIRDAVRQFCELPLEDAEEQYANNPIDTLTLPQFCWEGVYAYEFLTYGIDFAPHSQQILFVDQFFGVEVSWTMGAMVDQVSTVLN